MGKFADLKGLTFSRLTVLARFSPKNTGAVVWECKCECGATAYVRSHALVHGRIVSCGCYHDELVAQRNRDNATHGMTLTNDYYTWKGMLGRCNNPKATGYTNYGGRGIRVCKAWNESFERFLSDMGPRPEGKTLDRINNDGNYEPENCRWADRHTQALNKRKNLKRRKRGTKNEAKVQGK